MKKRLGRRIIAAILCIMMMFSSISVYADNENAVAGSFYLSASTAAENVIEPTIVNYKAGQTVKEALMDSGYSFGGVETGFINSIEGIDGNYSIFFNDGGYDLNKAASEVSLVAFAEGELYSAEMVALITRMGEYKAMTNNVQKYEKAAQAYAAALDGIRSATAANAKTLLDALNAAIAEYEDLFKGTKYTVSVTATQGDAALAESVVTLTDMYGNETTAKGSSVSVIAGEYEFSVSDGGYNRTEGTVSVSADTAISVTLPSGQWFDDIKLLDANKNPFDYTIDKVSHTAEYFIDDSIGTTGIRINATRGESTPVENNKIAAKLYACYMATDGSNDYGSDAKASNARSWESTTSALTKLVDTGMEGREIAIEARYTGADGYIMIQSYDVKLTRVPTLTNLVAKDENGTLLLTGFDTKTKEYSFNTINSVLDIEAETYGDEGYSVSVSAPKVDAENPDRAIIEGTEANKVDVTVSHTSGSSRTYSLNVTKVAAANVTMVLPENTIVEIQNVNGSIIEPKEGSVYELVPGETYTYIATKNVSHHTSATFVAAEGLNVQVAAPEDADTLTDFAIYNAASYKTRAEYVPDSEFSATDYDYEFVLPDAISAVYAQATGVVGYTVTARYPQQHIAANSSYNGVLREQKLTYQVSETKSATNLTRALAKCAHANVVTIRVWKEADGVTYYQDYNMKVKRALNLNSFAVFSGSEELTLVNENKELLAFDRDVKEYYVELPSDVNSINIKAAFMNEDDTNELCGGYYAMIGDVRYDSVSDMSFEMDSSKQQEDIVIKICHVNTDVVENEYTLHIKKVDPVEITFETTPKDAIVFLTNQTDNKNVGSQNNVFKLIPGQKYTYSVTASGYVGVQETDYVVPEKSETIKIELTKAAENDKLIEVDSEWPSFRADYNNNGVVEYATPIMDEEAVLYWANKVGSGYGSGATGCPILAGGYLYTYAGTAIVKVDTVTGEVVASGTMNRNSSFAINSPTYADGMIFVGMSNGGVQAFNADTLESLWIYNDALKGQPNCQLTYHDGYLYTGFWNGEASAANYVCLSVTDEDPTRGDEEKKASWTYKQDGGFYWAGAYVSDDFMIVGTDDGESGYSTGYAHVLSIDPKSGVILDDVQLPHVGDLRSNIIYDENGTKDYYFTTKGGYFYGISVNSDGTFKEDSLRFIKLENGTNVASMSTCTPTVYNGRAYVGVSGSGQFSAYSGHNITVLDLVNWKIAYSVPTQGYPQTSGILTTAYEEESGKVYVYFFDNYTPGKLRMLSDKPGQTKPAEATTENYTSSGNTVAVDAGYVLFTPNGAQAQYAICSPIVDEYGTMYFKNDSAYMMALGSTIEKIEVTKLPDKTEYGVGSTFDATGMEVTATYTNGKTRDITKYVSYTTDPLTVNDTEIQITFDHVMYQNKDGEKGVEYTAPMAMVNITFTVDAAYVTAKIDALDETVTLESKEAIEEAKAAYGLLGDTEKANVTNYDKLVQKIETLGMLEAAELVKTIDAIGEVSLEKEPEIISARTAYDALPESCKSSVTNLATLEAAEERLAELKADKKAADAVMAKIDSIGEVTLESAEKITEAREAYNKLAEAQMMLVTNLEILEVAEERLAGLYADKEAADEVAAMITAIGEVTLDSEAAISAAREAYNLLTESQKSFVTNLASLEAAEARLVEVKGDKAAADAVVEKINGIGEVTLESEAVITEVRAVYNGLTEAQKAFVTNLATLEAAETKLAEIQADKAVADVVVEKINRIGEVALESETVITETRAAYESLTENQKAFVTNLETLKNAEVALAELKAEEVDRQAAAAVIEKIEAIGEVTLEIETVIAEAESAYAELTDLQKLLVSNYDTLTAARTTIEQLKKEAADMAAAAPIIEKINAIGEVTLESETVITDARTAYDELTDEQKAYVTNLEVLTDAEIKLAELKADKVAADAVIAKIETIGEVTLESEAVITEAEEAYAALTDAQKALVNNYDTLTTARATIEQLKFNAELGDVNDDGVINADDALAVLKHAAKIESIDESRLVYADVNKDEVVNADDALQILKLAAHLIESFE